MYKTSMLNKFAAGKKQGHSSGGTSMLLSKIVMTLVYTTNY